MTDTTTATNWRTMDAGNALDRIIAERLGAIEFLDGSDGNLYYHTTESAKTGWMLDAKKWSTDTNATLSLLAADKTILWRLENVSWADGNPYTYECGIADEYGDYRTQEAATPARAICRAWLAYQERENA